jgi:hypothetical protein
MNAGTNELTTIVLADETDLFQVQEPGGDESRQERDSEEQTPAIHKKHLSAPDCQCDAKNDGDQDAENFSAKAFRPSRLALIRSFGDWLLGSRSQYQPKKKQQVC